MPKKAWSLASAALLALSISGCAASEPNDENTGSSEAEATSGKVLRYSYLAQQNGYYCGPASARIALSTRMSPPTQSQLASYLHTDSGGTDSVNDVIRGLNHYAGDDIYDAIAFYIDHPQTLSADQKAKLWDDIVYSIDNNYGMVMNIVAYADNHPPGYPSWTAYHYISLVGYNPATKQVYIADPALFSGIANYWLPLDQLASLIAPRGYTTLAPKGMTCAGGTGSVRGAIEDKYVALGGCSSFLGVPTKNQQVTPDGIGRYGVFEHGSIYWSPNTKAHEVHGSVRDVWATLKYEAGFLGYPITDQEPTSDKRGMVSKFEHGAVYVLDTGTWAVHGRIYDRWITEGGEQSALGYPTITEYDDHGLRRSDFEHGSITWDPKTLKTAVIMSP